MRWLVAVLASVFVLPGCGSLAVVDWVDFVRLDGVSYLAQDMNPGRPLTDQDLGPVAGRVEQKLSDNVNDPSYRPRDGDAAFIEAGTPVFSLKGYDRRFRVAARSRGRLLLYEADTHPRAKRGSDLLDIGGRVRRIGINAGDDGVTELGAIDDQERVDAIVDMVLTAPVDQDKRHEGTEAPRQYFIAFELQDGTISTRAYLPDSGELSRGILVPDSFRMAIEQALGQSS